MDNTLGEQQNTPMGGALGEFADYKFSTEIKDSSWVHSYSQIANNTLGFTHGAAAQAQRSETWRRDRILGEGSFGVVWLEREEMGALRAVKKLSKTRWNKSELHALTLLNKYPQHFVQFLGWFEYGQCIYIALEYIKYGDLGAFIQERLMTEGDTIAITIQLLEGVKVMHKNGLCHRDLKPQNILMASLSPLRIKITDFGVSKQTSDNTALRSEVGTPLYMAPEVIGYLSSETSEYTTAVDIWSLGCLVHVLITKEAPFPRVSELLEYLRGWIPFPEKKLVESNAKVSAIRFIAGLMTADPGDRLTAEMALKDPWLKYDYQRENPDTSDQEAFIAERNSLKIENKMLRSLNTDQNAQIEQLKMEINRLEALTTDQNTQLYKLRAMNDHLRTLTTTEPTYPKELSVLDSDEPSTMRYPAGVPVKLQLNGGSPGAICLGPRDKNQDIEYSAAYKYIQQRQQKVHAELEYGAIPMDYYDRQNDHRTTSPEYPHERQRA